MVSAPKLLDGERVVVGDELDLLVAERPGRPDRRLIVFLPGAVHLARISYGLPGLDPLDFLAHWVADAGHPFLAVSYPMDVVQPPFESADPSLEFGAYIDAVADTTAALIERWSLPKDVIVLGWSAAGNQAPRMRRALGARGIELDLFVALAATPPIPNLVLGGTDAAESYFARPESLTGRGLLSHRAIRSFTPELQALKDQYGRDVLPVDRYEAEILGDMPVGLFPGLSAQFAGSDGGAVVDHGQALAASGGTEWAEYPLVGVIQPAGVLDARHAITDRSNWAMVNNNAIFGRLLAGVDLPALSSERWHDLIALSDAIPDRLHRRIDGGHLFFVGVDGARQTIEAVQHLAAEADSIKAELSSWAED